MVSFIPNSYNVYLYMHSINPIFYRIFYISILLIFFPFLWNGFEPYFIVLVSITSKVKYVCHCSALQQRVETNVFLCKWFGMYYVGKYICHQFNTKSLLHCWEAVKHYMNVPFIHVSKNSYCRFYIVGTLCQAHKL